MTSSPTFKEIWVVLSIRAHKEELFWLGFGGENGNGIAYALYGDGIWCRHLTRQGHFRLGHWHKTRTDLIQVKQVASSLLGTLLQAHHDLINTNITQWYNTHTEGLLQNKNFYNQMKSEKNILRERQTVSEAVKPLTCLKGSQLLAGLAGLVGFFSRSRADMISLP